ncbi:hypothetical protein [Bacillus sp. 3255]|nr:hypothetical protein [Bacillus sp. 3255]
MSVRTGQGVGNKLVMHHSVLWACQLCVVSEFRAALTDREALI